MTIKREQMQVRLLFAECEKFVRSQNDDKARANASSLAFCRV